MLGKRQAIGMGACLIVGLFAWQLIGKQWLPVAQSASGQSVPVMRVIANNQSQVILPQQHVWQWHGHNYVKVINDELVTGQIVQVQPWRAGYYLVKGLSDQDLVILDEQVFLGQRVSYQLINPEAGQSGLTSVND